MKAVLLILVGVVVGYQLGKAAQRRAESSYEMGSDTDADTDTGSGRKLAGLAAAASMSAMHRVRNYSSARS
jgi:hypothetical protein